MTNVDSDSSITKYLTDCPLGGIFDKNGGINVGGAPGLSQPKVKSSF